MFYKSSKIALIIAAIATLPACQTMGNGNNSGVVYRDGQALAKAQVVFGTIRATQDAQIESNSGLAKLVGGATGGIVGNAAGRQVGAGHGSQLAGLLGGVAGAFGGAIAADHLARTDGKVYTVELELGGTIQVVQAGTNYAVGERVGVQRIGGTFRITSAAQAAQQ